MSPLAAPPPPHHSISTLKTFLYLPGERRTKKIQKGGGLNSKVDYFLAATEYLLEKREFSNVELCARLERGL